MKKCPACGKFYDDEYLVCPEDSSILDASTITDVAPEPEPPADPTPEGALEPAAPRRVDTSSLIDAALGALDGHKTRERAALLARMHRLDLYNTHCHAVMQFVQDLTSHSDHFSYTVRNMNEDARMWMVCTLIIGEGTHLRRFPVRVTYDRELGHDVRLEIDLQEIGATPEERIERTEKAGGRAASTRFGWSYIVRAPREFDDVENVVAWLRKAFWSIFRLAYGVE